MRHLSRECRKPNGTLEREVQDMLTGTRTLLVAAGLLGHVWSYAAPCYMHLDNCMVHPKLGQSAWSKRSGEEFRGQLIPLGTAVIFKPSPTKLAPHKPLPSASFGILWGYRFALGGHWSGECLPEERPDFVDVEFRMDSPRYSKSLSPHATKQVRQPKDGDSLPADEALRLGEFHDRRCQRALTE